MTNTNLMVNNLETFDNAFTSLTNTVIQSLPTENIGGIETAFYQFEDKQKDDSGKEIIVTRKVTNPVLLANIANIQSIDLFGRYSTTKLTFSLTDFTKEQAEMYKCKSIIELVFKLMPKLAIDRTTAAKYRKVGLWATIVGDDGKRRFRNGIDADVSINTLDRCTTLVAVDTNGKKVDLESCNSEELEKLYNQFYQKYVITGKISLNASQSTVKEQIANILKEEKNVVKTIEEDTSKNSDNSSNDNNNSDNYSNTTNSENNSDNLAEGTANNDNSQTIQAEEENIQKSAEEHINLLKTIFKDNKNAINLLSKLLKEVANLK